MRKIFSVIVGLLIVHAVVAQSVSHLKLRPESGWSAVDGVLPTITLTVSGMVYTATPSSATSNITYTGVFPLPRNDYSMEDNFGRHYGLYPFVISPYSIAVYFSYIIQDGKYLENKDNSLLLNF